MQAAALHSIIGPSGRLSYLFGRACARLPGVTYARHVLITVDAEALPEMPRGYSVRRMTATMLDVVRTDAGPEVRAARLAAGMTCLGAFDRSDALVGVTWIGPGPHDETVLGVRFRLPPGAAWDGGLWIDEERRMSRAFVALWAGMRLWLGNQGLRQSVSSIADYNAASVAAHRRLGARVLGHVAVLRIAGVQMTFAGGMPRVTVGGRWPEVGLGI